MMPGIDQHRLAYPDEARQHPLEVQQRPRLGIELTRDVVHRAVVAHAQNVLDLIGRHLATFAANSDGYLHG